MQPNVFLVKEGYKATNKNSGTFENTPKKVDFPLSIVFDQALQLLFYGHP